MIHSILIFVSVIGRALLLFFFFYLLSDSEPLQGLCYQLRDGIPMKAQCCVFVAVQAQSTGGLLLTSQ